MREHRKYQKKYQKQKEELDAPENLPSLQNRLTSLRFKNVNFVFPVKHSFLIRPLLLISFDRDGGAPFAFEKH